MGRAVRATAMPRARCRPRGQVLGPGVAPALQAHHLEVAARLLLELLTLPPAAPVQEQGLQVAGAELEMGSDEHVLLHGQLAEDVYLLEGAHQALAGHQVGGQAG